MTGKKLKGWRKANGYTQKSLAEALQIHWVTIAKYEAETNKIPRYIELALQALEAKKK